MSKKANKIVDYQVSAMMENNRYVIVPDVESYTSPDIGFSDGEIKGAGIFGTVNRPDVFNADALEAKITLNSWSDESKYLINPDGVSVKVVTAVDSVTPEGNSGFDSYVEYLKGWPKSIPGGDKKKGEKLSNEITLSLRYYKLIVNGEVRTEYAPLSGVFTVNGNDLTAGLKAALNQ